VRLAAKVSSVTAFAHVSETSLDGELNQDLVNCSQNAMPNLTFLFKEEISRIARKEVRAETARLRKNSSQCRSEIPALKRSLAGLDRQLRRNLRDIRQAAAPIDDNAQGQRFRFSAKDFAAQRQRLGLSAREVAVAMNGQERGRRAPQ
jgi:hypothetical protein